MGLWGWPPFNNVQFSVMGSHVEWLLTLATRLRFSHVSRSPSTISGQLCLSETEMRTKRLLIYFSHSGNSGWHKKRKNRIEGDNNIINHRWSSRPHDKLWSLTYNIHILSDLTELSIEKKLQLWLFFVLIINHISCITTLFASTHNKIFTEYHRQW